jgi:hypothetical protein
LTLLVRRTLASVTLHRRKVTSIANPRVVLSEPGRAVYSGCQYTHLCWRIYATGSSAIYTSANTSVRLWNGARHCCRNQTGANPCGRVFTARAHAYQWHGADACSLVYVCWFAASSVYCQV